MGDTGLQLPSGGELLKHTLTPPLKQFQHSHFASFLLAVSRKSLISSILRG